MHGALCGICKDYCSARVMLGPGHSPGGGGGLCNPKSAKMQWNEGISVCFVKPLKSLQGCLEDVQVCAINGGAQGSSLGSVPVAKSQAQASFTECLTAKAVCACFEAHPSLGTVQLRLPLLGAAVLLTQLPRCCSPCYISSLFAVHNVFRHKCAQLL